MSPKPIKPGTTIRLITGERVELVHDFPRDQEGYPRGLADVKHPDGTYDQIWPEAVAR